MRRADREVTDKNGILEIINNCKVCRIALCDDEGLYIVPLNFGYEFLKDENFCLYFHCAKTGRKIDSIQKCADVAFEMDCLHELVAGEKACDYGYKYASIIGNGQAYIISETAEKQHALAVLMKHQTGRDFTIEPADTQSVLVFKIVCSSYSAKARR